MRLASHLYIYIYIFTSPFFYHIHLRTSHLTFHINPWLTHPQIRPSSVIAQGQLPDQQGWAPHFLSAGKLRGGAPISGLILARMSRVTLLGAASADPFIEFHLYFTYGSEIDPPVCCIMGRKSLFSSIRTNLMPIG